MLHASAESVREQILRILTAWGMDRAPAETAAALMTETDLSGVDSHGVSMLMMYEDLHCAGRLNLKARPRIVRENACTALMDADAGLGHPAAAQAMDLAVEKALAAGVAMVGVRNSHHFGAAGVYARRAAERGVIGMVTSSTRFVTMVPTRGSQPVLGTNPLAMAAPARRNRNFSFDMATTTAAVNKVKVYDLNNRPLPEGWVVDGQDRPVTDAAEAMEYLMERPEGGLTPLGGSSEALGGHKGYGLGLMVHIMAGTLTGGSFSPIRNRTQKPGDPDNIGHTFLAIDPKAFRDEGEFEADVDAVIDVLHATPAVDPEKPVLVAGEPEAESRERRLKDGIPVPDKLASQIQEICTRCGAAFLLRPAGAGESASG